MEQATLRLDGTWVALRGESLLARSESSLKADRYLLFLADSREIDR
jgi:hypothetical protein